MIILPLILFIGKIINIITPCYEECVFYIYLNKSSCHSETSYRYVLKAKSVRLEILENQPVQDHHLLGGKFALYADVALLAFKSQSFERGFCTQLFSRECVLL